MIASLKQKLEQLTTKVVIMQEQSAAASAEEAQSIARMHEILESKDRGIGVLDGEYGACSSSSSKATSTEGGHYEEACRMACFFWC